jgi:hypothetical protein
MFQIDQETKELFLDRIKQLLQSGESIQKVKSNKSTTTRKRRLANQDQSFDDVIETAVTVQTVRDTILKPTPKWVFDLIVSSMSVEGAIELLQSQGYIIADPNHIPESETVSTTRGLSDFAIMEIRSKLLGVELQPVED